jgi:hypothetical protein
MLKSLAKLLLIWLSAGLIPSFFLSMSLVLGAAGHVEFLGVFVIFFTMLAAWSIAGGILFTSISFFTQSISRTAFRPLPIMLAGAISGAMACFAMRWNLDFNGLELVCGAAYGAFIGWLSIPHLPLRIVTPA